MKKAIIIIFVIIAMFIFTLPSLAADQYYTISFTPYVQPTPLYIVLTDGEDIVMFNFIFTDSGTDVIREDISITYNSSVGYVIRNISENIILSSYGSEYDPGPYNYQFGPTESRNIGYPGYSFYINQSPPIVNDTIPINNVTFGPDTIITLNGSSSEATTEEDLTNNNSDIGIINLGSLFDIITTWIRNIVNTIVSNPVLMLGLGIFITGSVVGLAYHIIRG